MAVCRRRSVVQWCSCSSPVGAAVLEVELHLYRIGVALVQDSAIKLQSTAALSIKVAVRGWFSF